MAADLTRGRPCLGLHYAAPTPCGVLLISCEDDLADTVVPRLLAAGADLSKVHHVQGVRDDGGRVLPFSMSHYQLMEAELAARPDIRAVVIDPAGAYIGRSGIDDHKDSELRALLSPMAELAARRQVTVILVKHFHKGLTAKAVHKVCGSAGYVNAARAVFVVTSSPDEEDRKLLLPVKFNLARWPSGLAFRTTPLDGPEIEAIVETFGHPGDEDKAALAQQLFRIHWEGPVTDVADEVFAKLSRCQGATDREMDQATDWLREFLKPRPAQSEECAREGNEKLGLTRQVRWWREQILKGRLYGRCRKTGAGSDGRWWFTLSDHPRPFPGLEDGQANG
jgi:hypothetical protein